MLNRNLTSDKTLLTFTLPDVPSAVVTLDQTASTVKVVAPAGTIVTALKPTLTVSSGATASPASGVAQNVTNPVAYTLTTSDGSTRVYTVTVTV